MKQTILIVDDTGFNRLVMVKYLTEAGYQTKEASNATEALRILGRERIDLVITDLMMPGMDGVTFLREASRQPAHVDDAGPIPLPPFILCTASQEKEMIQNAISKGFNDIILKPITRDRLLNSVNKTLLRNEQTTSLVIKLHGESVIRMEALAEALQATPEEIIDTILLELAEADLGEGSVSLDGFRQYLHDHFLSF